MSSAKFSLDLEKLSDDDLDSIARAAKVVKDKRAAKDKAKKDAGPYRDLLAEKVALEKEIKTALKSAKKFSITINVPVTIEANVSGNVDDVESLGCGDSLFYYEGSVKLPKTIDGLTKEQYNVLKSEFANYNEVCDEFLTPFAPNDLTAIESVLEKKCTDWVKKVQKAGYSPSDF